MEKGWETRAGDLACVPLVRLLQLCRRARGDRRHRTMGRGKATRNSNPTEIGMRVVSQAEATL